MSKLKKLICGLLLGLFLLPSGAVMAQENLVTDDAHLLTGDQIQKLNQQANEISEKIKGKVYVVTTNENYQDTRDFADQYLYDRVGKDNNGAVLVLDMNQRHIQISTSGNMIDYLTDSRLNKIYDAVEDGMRNESYYEAVSSYLTNANDFVEAGVPGGHYRVDEKTGKITRYKVLTPGEIALAFIAALVISLIFFVVTKSKYQLRMGGYKYPYRQNSSVKLTAKEDRLVNSFVTTRRIPRNNNIGGFGGGGGGSSTHSGPGGGTFGGGGGRSF